MQMTTSASIWRRTKVASMSAISRVIDLLPYVGRIRRALVAMRESEGRYPAGHYYSPIPNPADVSRHVARLRAGKEPGCPGIAMRAEEQYALLQDFARCYRDLPYGEGPRNGYRYHFGQEWFCYSDAIYLHCYLRTAKPRRVVEVGSGFSSAVVLDAAEHFLAPAPDIVLVEPDASRLRSLLREGDLETCRIIEDQVQNVPLSIFTALGDGDLLFIDSSHVLKAGNDLYFLLFDVLPLLAKGVTVHFHDVFSDFDYPPEWLLMGRYWNEAYFLRAFLSYNSDWRVRLFGSYAGLVFRDFLAQAMPLCLKNTGGSIYIQRTSAPE
jgi:hypothetical protein